ncbi:MAG: hypothetical protein ACRDVM_04615, partial [Acidimicrobiia bacterium]
TPSAGDLLSARGQGRSVPEVVVVAPDLAAAGRVVAALGSADAVTGVTEVTDAVKLVQGGLVVGEVDRDELARPVPPYAVRRRWLGGAPFDADPVTAVARAGGEVRVMPG